MEIKVAVGNETWIVPAHSIQSLVGWLNANAVSTRQRQEIREVRNDGPKDPRQLIVE